MTEKLATFRINEEVWQAFKSLCKDANSNASAVLVAYIQEQVKGGKLQSIPQPSPPTHLDNALEQYIDQKVEEVVEERLRPLLVQVESLDANWGKSAA